MKIQEFLEEKNVPFEMLPHAETFDAQRMAATLHVSGRQVAKTVLLRANSGSEFFVAVLPANKSVDLELASKMLGGSQIELADESEIAKHCPDCELGALPPFGSEYCMKTIVDASLAEVDEIVFEANTHHEAVKMKFEDYQRTEEPMLGSFAC